VRININIQHKAANITLDPTALAEAKQLGINISQACERGLIQEIQKTKAKKWRQENAEALASSNDWVAKYGVPLAEHRKF
jgi:antitoxin CcdA